LVREALPALHQRQLAAGGTTSNEQRYRAAACWICGWVWDWDCR
jgi:hypothetical protein